jgi:hypothetical protein
LSRQLVSTDRCVWRGEAYKSPKHSGAFLMKKIHSVPLLPPFWPRLLGCMSCLPLRSSLEAPIIAPVAAPAPAAEKRPLKDY